MEQGYIMTVIRYILIALELILLAGVVLCCIPGVVIGGLFDMLADSAMRRGDWLIQETEV